MTAPKNTQATFGIRISLPKDDPFTTLVDDNWHAIHWYPTQTARNTALEDMRKEHVYSRHGDSPALIFEAIEGGPA